MRTCKAGDSVFSVAVGTEFDATVLAKLLGALESKVYPASVRLGWRDFLSDIQEHSAEHIVLVLDRGAKHALAYLVAFRDPGTGVLYVSDVARDPKLQGEPRAAVMFALLSTASTLFAGEVFVAELREPSRHLLDAFCDVLEAREESDYFDDGASALCVRAVVKPPAELDVIWNYARERAKLQPSARTNGDWACGPRQNVTDLTLKIARAGGRKFYQTDFRYADLSGLDLSHADCRFADWQDADLHGTNLAHSNLAFGRFNHTAASEADLTGANLARAQLEFTTLEKVKLAGANLRHAAISDSRLVDVDFTRADLNTAVFVNSTLVRVRFDRANLHLVRFRTGYASDVSLVGANLQAAEFESFECVDMDFTRANLYLATFSDMRCHNSLNLSGADLSNANMQGVRFESGTMNLKGARWNEHTIWPPGFKLPARPNRSRMRTFSRTRTVR